MSPSEPLASAAALDAPPLPWASGGANSRVAADSKSGEAVLGVEHSVTGRRWTPVACDEALAASLAQRHALPEVVGRVLAARGVGLASVERFLAPRLRDLLPDPLQLQDMRRGAERVAAAVMRGERLAVYGDYDVDGATSAALLLRFLAAAGARDTALYVPDRLREGYGPNAAALLGLRGAAVSVVVTVDCGINAHAALQAAAEAGLDVIVVDHHQGGETLPPAFAVVNPNRQDEGGDLGHLAAVGVAFLLAVDVNRVLRAAGWYAARPEPDLRRWLDLVALGTVCDMVPLQGVNRAFVTQGLKILAASGNPGLQALAAVAGLSRPPSARDLAFALGPRVNAGGRIGAADLGARLLSTDDPGEAVRLSRQLDALNRERRALEQRTFEAALLSLDSGDAADAVPFVCAVGNGWHPGVIGIVASRLVERLRRPAIVIACDGDLFIASGRSLPGIDLGAAVNAALQAGLLLKGGGHAMAAGCSGEVRQLEALRAFLAPRLQGSVDAHRQASGLLIDGVLGVGGAAALPAETLQRLGPFGVGHAEPRFALSAVRVEKVITIGEQHLHCRLGEGNAGLAAIAFRAAGTALGRALARNAGAPLHLAGRLQPAFGERGALQLLIDDAAPVWPS